MGDVGHALTVFFGDLDGTHDRYDGSIDTTESEW